MADATLDDRGRLTLPEPLRDRFGDRFHVVPTRDGIKLIPAAGDPLVGLRTAFAAVERSPGQLRERARRAALDRAGR